ncbi:MAG TPA: response regulator [Longimicrobiales bacterium]|nr:response regulator [Longimicrobiales bacterium]
MGARRILLVDGDSDSRSIYRIMLKHSGYDVVEVEDGHGALVATLADCDAVVMELTLRGPDGHSLLAELLRKQPALCVVVLTARALEEDRERAVRAGCRRYLTKPLEPQQLVRELDELLG